MTYTAEDYRRQVETLRDPEIAPGAYLGHGSLATLAAMLEDAATLIEGVRELSEPVVTDGEWYATWCAHCPGGGQAVYGPKEDGWFGEHGPQIGFIHEPDCEWLRLQELLAASGAAGDPR